MQTINFRDCTLVKVEKLFGLQEVKYSEKLKEWLAMPYNLDDFEKKYLLRLQNELNFNIFHWNEQELSLNFIGPIFSFVDFSNEKFNSFASRLISIKIDDFILSGIPDGMVASGKREPEIPFFCFQEYKKESEPDGHPAGQVLAAMYAGAVLNDNQSAVYGCYNIGKSWAFLVLENKKYCISHVYTVDDEEIFDVYRILQNLKTIITNLVN